MLISDAFDLYEKNYMAIRHQSRRICETHSVCKRWLIEAVGDKDMVELTVADISNWIKNMRKTKCTNTCRNYVTIYTRRRQRPTRTVQKIAYFLA